MTRARGDSFIIGITEPTRYNTGCKPGTSLAIHNGDLIISTAGAVIENRDITGCVTITASNVTLRNCIVRGGPDTPTTRFLITVQTTTTNTLIERVTVTPSNPSLHSFGVRGANYTIRRSFIGGAAPPGDPNYLKDGVVDALNFDPSNCRAEGCCLETSQYPSPTETGGYSHSDGIQISGGQNYRVIGCSFNAQSQGIVLTPYRSLVFGVEVRQNWFYGAFTQFSGWPRWDEGGPGIAGLYLIGNRFKAKEATSTGVHYNMLLTPDSNAGAYVRDNVLLDGVTPLTPDVYVNNQGTLPAPVGTPIANAGPDQWVQAGMPVALMMRGQTDAGIPTQWRWERADGGPNIVRTRVAHTDVYTAPVVTVAETVTWRLITTTTTGVDSAPDTCVVTHLPA